MVPRRSRADSKPIRLLLDQGFPKPPGFNIRDIDATVKVTHLSDFDSNLSDNPTPDWYIYCRAAEAGFDALVTRDHNQLGRIVEMIVLSRLERFAVISWRKPIEDPMVEWGQLLAHLPLIRKRLYADDFKSSVMLLPKPSLSKDSMEAPSGLLGKIATDRKLSVAQVRHDAWKELMDELSARGELDRFKALLHM